MGLSAMRAVLMCGVWLWLGCIIQAPATFDGFMLHGFVSTLCGVLCELCHPQVRKVCVILSLGVCIVYHVENILCLTGCRSTPRRNAVPSGCCSAPKHTRKHSRTNSRSHAHTHEHTQTFTHTHTHTHACTHT